MNNPTPKSIIQLLSEKLLFHSVFLSLFYPHNQILSTGSRTRDRTLIHHLLSNGKNPYHTQLLLLNQTSPITLNPSTNQIPIILTTLQQLLVCSLNRYHTIVNHEDDIHNPAQTMCHHSRMSLSTPSTPSRTYPISRCSTHSSPRPEGGSMDCDNANRCFRPPNTAFPTAPRSVLNRSGISLISPNTTPPPTLHLSAFSPHRAGDWNEWFQRTSPAPD